MTPLIIAFFFLFSSGCTHRGASPDNPQATPRNVDPMRRYHDALEAGERMDRIARALVDCDDYYTDARDRLVCESWMMGVE